MRNKQHHFKLNLKNFFFNNNRKQTSIPLTIQREYKEDENLRDYIEAYQKVTRWK